MTHFLDHGFEAVPSPAQLLDNLYAMPFRLMKLVPASYMLKRALEKGLISSDTTIIETSSGNLAMGLALECHRLHLPFVLVTDSAVSASWSRRLIELGTKVVMADAAASNGNVQRARLALLEQQKRRYPNHYVTGQYDNSHNHLAYGIVAERISETIGHVDILVSAMGSGASGCGTAGSLRALNPRLKLVAVDTHRSVLFGQPNGPRILRGLGNSLHPLNLDHSAVDDVHWVSGAVAAQAMRRLYANHRLFQGPTSGAAFVVAEHYARACPDQKVVFLCPDDGERYVDSFHNQEWVIKNGLYLPTNSCCPIAVSSPDTAAGEWNCFEWRRRTFIAVTGAPLIRPEAQP